MKITFEIDKPDDCTDEQFEEFLNFELCIMGGIKIKNPLSDRDFWSCNTRNMEIQNW